MRNELQDLPSGSLDRKTHLWPRIALLVLISALLLALPALASADQSRAYTGVSFGPDGMNTAESFGGVQDITVDQSTGDVYVYDGSGREPRVYKFDSAGTPINFSSTQTNYFAVRTSGTGGQIAIAPVGAIGGTEGDIYFAGPSQSSGEYGEPSVVVFGPSGARLGAIGPAKSPFLEAKGITTDSLGQVIVATSSSLTEYAPTTNPPTEADFVESRTTPNTASRTPSRLASDADGNLYVVSGISEPKAISIFKYEGITDPEPAQISFSLSENSSPTATVAVDSVTGNLLADNQSEVVEYGSGGSVKLGTFGAGQISSSIGVAVGASSNQAYVSDGRTGKVKVFGPPITVPTVTVGQSSFPTPVEATVTGSVDPEGTTVTECFVEYGANIDEYEEVVPCESLPPTDSEPHAVSATLTDLEPDGVTYHYRLVAGNASIVQRTPDQTLVTASTVQTGEVENITETTATVTGRLFPNGNQYATCEFEYGPVSNPGFAAAVECSPKAAEIEPNQAFHRVIANLTGLQPNNISYKVRLKATTTQGLTIEGETIIFRTSGDAMISGVRAADADQHSVTLEATVDPSGFQTTYRIEWGPTDSYGNTATTGSIGPTSGPTRISARLDALSVGASYHYRIVVSNGSAHLPAQASLDREFETLNECELPERRCFELASEREAGPTASPGKKIPLLSTELVAQAAERPGALAYVSESGYPGATRGAGVLYRASRGSTGWSSSQLSPPITVRDEQNVQISNSSRTLALSPELSCGLVESNQPLPGISARMSEVLEAGGTNLYRLNADGSYTPISTVPPEDLSQEALGGEFFRFAGMSPDCNRVYFVSVYRYPGTQVQSAQLAGNPAYLYEWADGTMRAVGFVPDSTGEAPTAAVPGNDRGFPNGRADRNAVSKDGSRIFFTADRLVASNSGEVGEPGLFVRENGSATRDVSSSETAVSDTNPGYQWATPDGSQVFFTAPAGLTSESNAAGTDLYVYDLDKQTSQGPLTDLSVSDSGGAAEVAGMLGGSDDGSRVYFAATGQLITGEGLSEEENRNGETYSLYLYEAGQLRFIATIGQNVNEFQPGLGLLLTNSSFTTSQVSANGRYLTFESALSEKEGTDNLAEIYLFDAVAPQEALICVSCVPGGRTQTRPPGYIQLPTPSESGPELAMAAPRAPKNAAGSPTVIFSSLEALAPGATAGQTNLFEWAHDQLFLLTAEPSDPPADPITATRLVFPLGSSADGSDLYLATPESLVEWEDADGRSSVYDARIGGGFPRPASPPTPCSPAAEGACQNPPSSPLGTPAPRTPGFVGPGNAKPLHCKKGQKKKHGKCKRVVRHHKSKHHRGKKRHTKARGHKHSGSRHSGQRVSK